MSDWVWAEHHHTELIRKVDQVLETQEQIMASVQDLTNGLAQCQTDLQALLAANSGAIPAADLDPVVQAITDLDNAIKAALPPA